MSQVCMYRKKHHMCMVWYDPWCQGSTVSLVTYPKQIGETTLPTKAEHMPTLRPRNSTLALWHITNQNAYILFTKRHELEKCLYQHYL